MSAPAERTARNIVAPAVAEVVKARDEAILAALKVRRWKTEGLLTVLPEEPGQTPDVRRAALKSALIRLRVRGFIREDAEGWTLA